MQNKTILHSRIRDHGVSRLLVLSEFNRISGGKNNCGRKRGEEKLALSLEERRLDLAGHLVPEGKCEPTPKEEGNRAGGEGRQSARVTCALPREQITCNVRPDKRKCGEPSRGRWGPSGGHWH